MVDLDSPESPQRLSENEERWDAVCYLPDGDTLAAVTSKSLVYYNAASLREKKRVHLDARGTAMPIAFTPDGANFALGSNRLGLHAASTGTLYKTFQQLRSKHIASVALQFTPEGRYLFSVDDRNSLQLFDTQAMTEPEENCRRPRHAFPWRRTCAGGLEALRQTIECESTVPKG